MTTPRFVVLGATGAQGGSVVRALLAGGEANIIAVTRNPDSAAAKALTALSPRVSIGVADINNSEQLEKVFAGATGAFIVSMFWEPSVMAHEYETAVKAVNAAKAAGVQHVVWSTAENAKELSGGKFPVVHFANKARVDAVVAAAGFKYHTFVAAPCYFQNLSGMMAPRKQDDGTFAWSFPIRNTSPVHFGDVSEVGVLAATALYKPETYGNGSRLYLSGQLITFDQLAADLSAASGSKVVFRPMAIEDWNKYVVFPGSEDLGQMFGWFDEFGYYGPSAQVQAHVDAARAISTPRTFSEWLKTAEGQKLIDVVKA